MTCENQMLKKELAEIHRQLAEERNRPHREVEQLGIQLQQCQQKVRVLKATMEQFLRLGIFNDPALAIPEGSTNTHYWDTGYWDTDYWDIYGGRPEELQISSTLPNDTLDE
ncbi:hypothetical protein DFQ30_006046 [Apophysomyces sp. BC1015]|nr:hypothetical protein DFQ30_006046 [Apophysomyces sp. BC1015]